MHTEQEKFDAALAAMAKAGWPVEYHDGEPLLLSEGNLGVDCFNAGYDMAAAALSATSGGDAELVELKKQVDALVFANKVTGNAGLKSEKLVVRLYELAARATPLVSKKGGQTNG